MKKWLTVSVFGLIGFMVMLSGCGKQMDASSGGAGGGSGAVIITGTVGAQSSDLSTIGVASASQVKIQGTDDVALPSATVKICTAKANGDLEEVSGVSSTTDKDGKYTLQSDNIAKGKTYIIKAYRRNTSGDKQITVAATCIVSPDATGAYKITANPNPKGLVISKMIVTKIVKALATILGGESALASALSDSAVTDLIQKLADAIVANLEKAGLTGDIPSCIEIVSSSYSDTKLINDSSKDTAFSEFSNKADSGIVESRKDSLLYGQKAGRGSNLSEADATTLIKDLFSSLDPEQARMMASEGEAFMNGFVLALRNNIKNSITKIVAARDNAIMNFDPQSGQSFTGNTAYTNFTNGLKTADEIASAINTEINNILTALKTGAPVSKPYMIAFKDIIDRNATIAKDEDLDILKQVVVFYLVLIKPAKDSQMGKFPVDPMKMFFGLGIKPSGILFTNLQTVQVQTSPTQSASALNAMVGFILPSGRTVASVRLTSPDTTNINLEPDSFNQGPPDMKQYVLSPFPKFDPNVQGGGQPTFSSNIVAPQSGNYTFTVTLDNGTTYTKTRSNISLNISQGVQNLYLGSASGTALNDNSPATTSAKQPTISWTDIPDKASIPATMSISYILNIEQIDPNTRNPIGRVYDGFPLEKHITGTSTVIPITLWPGTYKIMINAVVESIQDRAPVAMVPEKVGLITVQ